MGEGLFAREDLELLPGALNGAYLVYPIQSRPHLPLGYPRESIFLGAVPGKLSKTRACLCSEKVAGCQSPDFSIFQEMIWL